ncbi:MAG: serine protein kinase PrkA [Thermodesulfobacteriota bacterium]
MGESQIYHGFENAAQDGCVNHTNAENLEKARRFLESINGHRIRRTLDYGQFLERLSANPQLVLRNVFQLFHDMIKSYIGDGQDDYPEDAESINYLHYDCSRLFVEGVDYPFFADRLFANRMVKVVETLKRSAQQNKIYIFKGPPGSGKSTFLNTLLRKFEEYTRTGEGVTYRTVWNVIPQDIGFEDTNHHCDLHPDKPLEIPCPSFDHPILLIPKAYRMPFFEALFDGQEILDRLVNDKEYDWIWRSEPCTICSSLYQALIERVKDSARVFDMIKARPYRYNRRLGEGINVFMPGDKPLQEDRVHNEELQKRINSVLGDSNRVKYIFSQYAKTNNGVYALMDIKGHNKTRLMDLHNIISEGLHKVEDIEERVHSLFLAVMNPEDVSSIQEFQSFEDRIEYIKVPYVMDLNTEVEIYRNTFGKQIDQRFLPRVLHNFARVIISSRLNMESPALLEWIDYPGKYRRYCDRNLHLLKMEIYCGNIPKWLSEEDRKQFTSDRRRKIIAEAESEGEKGISGRESIKIFNEFYSRYAKDGKLINMRVLYDFFKSVHTELMSLIPEGFLAALMNLYNYTVLQEVKESLYSYNEERVSRDVQNYIFAVNFETDTEEKSSFTGEHLEITEEFFRNLERRMLGGRESEIIGRVFREETQKRYATETLPSEIIQSGRHIRDTALYQALYERYVYNLKENVLDPFIENENFRRAIRDLGEDEFKTYDKRIQEEVGFLIHNLEKRCGYNREGAKEVCIYVVDNDLARKFDEP